MSDSKIIKETIKWIPVKKEPKTVRCRYLLKHRRGVTYGYWLYDGFYYCDSYKQRNKLKTVTHYAAVKGP